MTPRLIIALGAVTLMAATGFAHAQGTDQSPRAAPAQKPGIETLSTQHADPNADRTVGESAKPGKNDEDSELSRAVRIDQQMSNESEGGYRRRHGR